MTPSSGESIGLAALRIMRVFQASTSRLWMSALAWNLKSWYGLLMPNRQRGLELVRMEFRRFLHAIVLLPAQIVCSGRKIIYRIMGYNSWLKDFFAAWENLRRMAPA